MIRNWATWVFYLLFIAWTRYLISLSLSFLLCAMGMIVGPILGIVMIEYMQKALGTVPSPL